jgi:uncharacterized protein DUF1707
MPMPSDPKMRASDADRDRTAALLREHHAAGRLTAEEFNERLDRTYAAKTLGELDQLLSDLPGIDLYELPDASLRRSRHGPHGLPWGSSGFVAQRHTGHMSGAWRAAWGSCLSVSLIAFLVWLLSGHPDSLWFLWVAGPYTLILLSRWLTGGPPHGRRGDGGA